MIVLGAAAVAVLSFVLVMLLVAYARYVRRVDLFSRLEKYHVYPRGGEKDSWRGESLSGAARRLLTRISSPFAEYSLMQAWDIKMRQAGIPLLGGEFLAALCAAALLAGIGAWMLFLDRLMAAAAGVSVILFLRLAVSLRIDMRRKLFVEQLGDALATIANALRAGYSFPQAMEAIAKEMEPPISEEFSQVTRELSLGMPLETSLESMNRRMESPDFDLVVTAVVIQREVGGNLAQILDTISETIGERIRMKREIYALTSQGRFSAWILFVLPFGIGFFMYCIHPEQIRMLFEDSFGRMALGVAFLLEVVGIVVIRRIVDIKM